VPIIKKSLLEARRLLGGRSLLEAKSLLGLLRTKSLLGQSNIINVVQSDIQRHRVVTSSS